MIGLADCNNFFVSCERVFRPDLADRPVIVLSNNDGCAVALSNEAKALGIRRGDPYFKFKMIADKENIAILSGNHKLYGDMSHRVMYTLRDLIPGGDIEIYSIDEAFMHLTDDIPDIAEFGRNVVRTVRRNTGIPISLGIAPSKTLAKIAARFAKKYAGYKGSCIIDSDDKRIKALELTDIDDVWGVGRRQKVRLRGSGVNTAADLSRLTLEQIRVMFNVTGERMWRELNGEACIERENPELSKKSITSSRTFATDITDFELLKQAICSFATIASRRLRENDGFAKSLEVWICTNRFHDYDPQYVNSKCVTLDVASDDTSIIAGYAVKALKSVYRSGYSYKRAGLTITDIESASGVQLNLFADTDINRRHRLMKAVDIINSSLKISDKIHIASVGDGLAALSRKEHASRLYTTRLSDIITVKSGD